MIRVRVVVGRTSAEPQPCWLTSAQSFNPQTSSDLSRAAVFAGYIEAVKARPSWAAAVTFHEVDALVA